MTPMLYHCVWVWFVEKSEVIGLSWNECINTMTNMHDRGISRPRGLADPLNFGAEVINCMALFVSKQMHLSGPFTSSYWINNQHVFKGRGENHILYDKTWLLTSTPPLLWLMRELTRGVRRHKMPNINTHAGYVCSGAWETCTCQGQFS